MIQDSPAMREGFSDDFIHRLLDLT